MTGTVGEHSFGVFGDRLCIGFRSPPDWFATDSDFWQRVQPNKILLVMLTLPQLSANLNMIRRLADGPYDGRITAVARFPDEVDILEEAGVHLAVDSFAEAGAGFAEHAQQQFAAELVGLDAREE